MSSTSSSSSSSNGSSSGNATHAAGGGLKGDPLSAWADIACGLLRPNGTFSNDTGSWVYSFCTNQLNAAQGVYVISTLALAGYVGSLSSPSLTSGAFGRRRLVIAAEISVVLLPLLSLFLHRDLPGMPWVSLERPPWERAIFSLSVACALFVAASMAVHHSKQAQGEADRERRGVLAVAAWNLQGRALLLTLVFVPFFVFAAYHTFLVLHFYTGAVVAGAYLISQMYLVPRVCLQQAERELTWQAWWSQLWLSQDSAEVALSGEHHPCRLFMHVHWAAYTGLVVVMTTIFAPFDDVRWTIAQVLPWLLLSALPRIRYIWRGLDPRQWADSTLYIALTELTLHKTCWLRSKAGPALLALLPALLSALGLNAAQLPPLPQFEPIHQGDDEEQPIRAEGEGEGEGEM